MIIIMIKKIYNNNNNIININRTILYLSINFVNLLDSMAMRCEELNNKKKNKKKKGKKKQTKINKKI